MRERGQDRDVMRERLERCGEREMRNRENEERESGMYIKSAGIKIYIILFYHNATVPSFILDDTIALCQKILEFYKTRCCSLLMHWY